jgi:hypothetical protein
MLVNELGIEKNEGSIKGGWQLGNSLYLRFISKFTGYPGTLPCGVSAYEGENNLWSKND